ncbi:hypothetical protein F5Y05DRAFT_396413 [Hypoxylon sp. FL0543]|nr:hypothetical protein F5Y05DRAFT_396413 [Hypoxylon sp. FL0543]
MVKQLSRGRYLCYGCSVLLPADKQRLMVSYWSTVPNHWRPGTNSRTQSFVGNRQHEMRFLTLLLGLERLRSP